MEKISATCVALSLILIGACGVEPATEGMPGGAAQEHRESALQALPFPYEVFTAFQGTNKPQATDVYSCAGWSYRMLINLEQHTDPSSPTGWYVSLGASQPSNVGTVSDVSADVYLQCYWGILPADHGTFPGGRTFNQDRLFVNLPDNPIPCTLRTVWPASWHAPDVITPVFLSAYDYVPGAYSKDAPNGTLSLALTSAYPADDPGRGWCGNGWQKEITLVNVSKLPLPPPAVMPKPKNMSSPFCSQNDYSPGCIVDYPPPCDADAPSYLPSSCHYNPA